MAMYSFVPPFREAKFYGVPSCFWQIRVYRGWKKVAEHCSRAKFKTSGDMIRSLSPMSNPQAGELPFVGCQRLLIQHIRSYPPYLETVYSIRNVRTRHAMVTRDPIDVENWWLEMLTLPIPVAVRSSEDKTQISQVRIKIVTWTFAREFWCCPAKMEALRFSNGRWNPSEPRLSSPLSLTVSGIMVRTR
jgi:hypothetical protein